MLYLCLNILDVIRMHTLDVILMHILHVLIHMHILHVLLLLLATTLIAPLFLEFQPRSIKAAGSVVVRKTTVLSVAMVLKHKYVHTYMYIHICNPNMRLKMLCD